MIAGLGIHSSNFGANHLFFAKKSERMRDALKKRVIRAFTHFWWATWVICSQLLIPSERPERIAHGHSFVLRDLSNSLTSLRRNEQIFFFFFTVKRTKNTIFLEFFGANRKFFGERIRKGAICSTKPSDSLICSFALSNLRKLLTFAHLTQAT